MAVREATGALLDGAALPFRRGSGCIMTVRSRASIFPRWTMACAPRTARVGLAGLPRQAIRARGEASRRLFPAARPPGGVALMDIRFLSRAEFDRVHFYRYITFVILMAAALLVVFGHGAAPRADVLLVGGGLSAMALRFAVEWWRLRSCAPAFINDDALFMSSDAGRRKIPLAQVVSVRSMHSVFMVRRYQSWSDHVAFLELTLRSGARVRTLVESAVLEHPAARDSVEALRAAVAAARAKQA